MEKEPKSRIDPCEQCKLNLGKFQSGFSKEDIHRFCSQECSNVFWRERMMIEEEKFLENKILDVWITEYRNKRIDFSKLASKTVEILFDESEYSLLRNMKYIPKEVDNEIFGMELMRDIINWSRQTPFDGSFVSQRKYADTLMVMRSTEQFLNFVEKSLSLDGFQVVYLGLGAGGRKDQALPKLVFDLSNFYKILVIQLDPGNSFPTISDKEGEEYIKQISSRVLSKPSNITYRSSISAFPASPNEYDEFTSRYSFSFINKGLKSLFENKISIFACSVDISGCSGNLLLGFEFYGYYKPNLILNAYAAQAMLYTPDVNVFTEDKATISVTKYGEFYLISGPRIQCYQTNLSECVYIKERICVVNMISGDMILDTIKGRYKDEKKTNYKLEYGANSCPP